MQFQALLAAALAVSGVLSTPVAVIDDTGVPAVMTDDITVRAAVAESEPADVELTTAAAKWTIVGFHRKCALLDVSCTYSFFINPNDKTGVTPCKYNIVGVAASRLSYQNIKCGAFKVGSTYLARAGVNNGVQTLSVARNGLVIYPAYTDRELLNGKIVKPNRSYTPVKLPQ